MLGEVGFVDSMLWLTVWLFVVLAGRREDMVKGRHGGGKQSKAIFDGLLVTFLRIDGEGGFGW